MKRTLVIASVLVVACAVALFYQPLRTDTPVVAENAVDATAKATSIEHYVRQNISLLSPEKEVLGGTFMVTDITVSNEGSGSGTGVVHYEDGHNAYTADFAYTVSDRSGTTITSFIIRK